jgi:monothiol glutaredoxin
MPMTSDLRQKIDQLVTSDAVVLFMKGNRSFPQCGFSASVVSILNTLVPKYTTVNILSEVEIRTAMKEYSDWPTFPQLYIAGEFVGGADIVNQMHQSGELAKKIGTVVPASAAGAAAGASTVAAPKVSVTPRAAQELTAALADGGPGDVIHVTITPQWEHQLDIGPVEASHVTVTSEGVTIQLDAKSASNAAGLVIDFIESSEGAGFKIENPNRPPTVRQIGPKELKALLETGKVKLYDVRTEKERAIASIAGATLLDDAALAAIEQLPRETPIALHCHHGGRSNAAAEHLLNQGFRTLYNLAGGIDAWSREVDPKVPRY